MLTRDMRFLGWLIVTCSILTVGFCREDNIEFGVMLVPMTAMTAERPW